MSEPTYQPPAHRIALVGDAWDTVQERYSDGGPGPGGQPETVVETPTAVEVFDPSGHTVEEVNTYLAGVDDTERERVLAAERDGQARKGVVGE